MFLKGRETLFQMEFMWLVIFTIYHGYALAWDNIPMKGIVKKGMKANEPWPTEGVTKFTHWLECDYRHDFPGDPYWTYTYDIRCINNTGQEDFTLSINYDNNVFDNFIVTSCDQEQVINSVFPPKQKDNYLSGEVDERGLPKVSYIKYRATDGKCYAKKYQFENRASTAAKRFKPVQIGCPGEPGWLKYGEVAQFTNCRVPKLPLSPIVKSWSTPEEPKWNPSYNARSVLLDCSFDQFSKYWSLKCTKGNKENEYFAFVRYTSWLIDRFTVKSCKEEDIVNGIFPIKETTANPKSGENYGWKIWFSTENGDCYHRDYDTLNEDVVKEHCPEKPDQWTNPTWGFAGYWRECKGPMSVRERGETQQPDKSEESEEEGQDQEEVELNDSKAQQPGVSDYIHPQAQQSFALDNIDSKAEPSFALDNIDSKAQPSFALDNIDSKAQPSFALDNIDSKAQPSFTLDNFDSQAQPVGSIDYQAQNGGSNWFSDIPVQDAATSTY